jgi:hypothetical protein
MTIKSLASSLPAADELLSAVGLGPQRTVPGAVLQTLGAFAVGAVLGSAIALLFAPKPGQELRRDVGDRLADVRQRVKGAGSRLSPSMKGQASQGILAQPECGRSADVNRL